MGKHPLPGYGPVTHGNRLVRTRMPGGVGAGGEIPPATRLAFINYILCFYSIFCIFYLNHKDKVNFYQFLHYLHYLGQA